MQLDKTYAKTLQKKLIKRKQENIMCTIYIFLLESSDITRAEKERALSEHNAQSSRSREKHLATSRVSPSLLRCSGRFLRALE